MADAWRKIAGRGVLGDMNWGASFDTPAEELEKQRQELLQHIGEKVLLTGGGGFGADIVTLAEVYSLQDLQMRDTRDGPLVTKKALQVKLTGCPKRYKDDPGIFTPYLDSWQISVYCPIGKETGRRGKK